ncbi:DC-STAMP domain-containing 2 [Labeo rohita]|uniref:DC-STAMP domain-containing 2 n=1 Tax=Labeo rohita TaxID=84645 RepID=A0A498NEJ5_LABRO|nr:DC-STAMP domain-containing 2 [Labeo rohita]
MARNAYSMAGRAQNFIRALTESVRHVSRTLRNVLHFLANIGDVCNDNLGLPYQKCTRLFDEARENCMELLSVFSFLCHLLDGFQSLCGLARVGQLFCILPSYIADHMKTALAFPTIAAFDRIKKEFEFNISTSINFDLLLNNSQSIQDAAQKIMEEVSEELGLLQEVKLLLAYLGFFLLLFMYLQAVLYKNKYLHNDNFENIYITDQFIELDRKRSRQGKAAVLPLSQRETLTYIRPCSLYLTVRERRAMAVQVNGSGYASDIFRDIAASFDILQKGNITVLNKKCLMTPLEPDYMRYLLIDCPLCAQSFCLSEVTECAIFEDTSNNNKAPKCAGCEEGEVSGWCVQCEETLCLDCTSAHHRVKMTRDHEVTPKKPPTGWIQRRRCPSHPQESLRFFCLVCEELTCKDCQLISHRGHSFVQQEEAVGSQRQQLHCLLDSIRHQKETVTSSLLLLETRLKDIENIKVAAKKMLRQVVHSIYQTLVLKAMQMLKEIEDAGVSSTNVTDMDHLESNLASSLVSETAPKEPSPDPAHSSGPSSMYQEKCSRQAQDGQSSNKKNYGPKHWSIGMPATFRQLVEATSIPIRYVRVSLVRLPISLPPIGEPLPEFHLTTDTSTDHILVHESQGGQVKQVWRWYEDPVPSRSSSCSVSQDSSPESDVEFCAVCLSAGAALLCVKCGSAFHFDCHIPPILTKPGKDWVCLLCQDVNETLLYGSEELGTPGLSLQDQRKCEKLLLGLLCDENKSLLYSATKTHSNTAEFDIILGRLLGKRKPPYRTAAELVSDIWTLLDILMMNSERKNMVVRLKISFQQQVNESPCFFPKSLQQQGTNQNFRD